MSMLPAIHQKLAIYLARLPIAEYPQLCIPSSQRQISNIIYIQRGLVPSLSYNGNVITESGIVAQFLADAHPSHLLPASGPAENALYRARLSFFVDAFFSKVIPHFFASLRSTSDADRDAAVELLVAGIVKEVEPLLADTEGKGPFFGGSDKLTLAEVCCISHVSFPVTAVSEDAICVNVWL